MQIEKQIYYRRETINATAIAFRAAKRLDEYIVSIRKQIKAESDDRLFSITDEILEAVEILKHRSSMLGVNIDFVWKRKIYLWGNPVRFHQLALNLISNAVDSYESLSVVKRVVSIRTKIEKEEIIFCVTDFGCGILAENLVKIFDPFFSTKNEKGTGLGLSTSKEITEKEFDGKIYVVSTEKIGTQFFIKIPVRRK